MNFARNAPVPAQTADQLGRGVDAAVSSWLCVANAEIMTRVGLFQAQKRILEDMFGLDWFESAPKVRAKHPAFQRWLLCRDLLSRDVKLRMPDDERQLPEIAQIVLDNAFLIQATGGDVQTLKLGDLENFGDEKVLARIKGEIPNPEGFLSVMTEVAYAAWHLSKGHAVKPYEDPGHPDFQIEELPLPLPVLADCKRIRGAAGPNRIQQVIKKANKQVKNADRPAFGLAVLNVSERVPNPEPFSDGIPDAIHDHVNLVRRAIARHNTSISGVLLLWNDYWLHKSLDEDGRPRWWIAFRRRSLLVRHNSPIYPLPEDASSLEIGNTVEFGVYT